MTTPSWHVSGQYYETCSCDFICLCFPGGLSVTPSKGTCTAAMAFQVERGSFGQVPLDDLGFILVTLAPEAMVRGNWMVGIVVDERATCEQREAIRVIASGEAGGPFAALSGFVGNFLGMQPASIRFDRRGHTWSVRASETIEMSGTGILSASPHVAEPVHFLYTGHPAADQLALARASDSHIHAFGLSWDDVSGNNNAQYAPFEWRSA